VHASGNDGKPASDEAFGGRREKATKSDISRNNSLLAVGAITLILAFTLLYGGGSVLWVHTSLIDTEGFISTGQHQLETHAYAIVFKHVNVYQGEWWWTPAFNDVHNISFTVSSKNSSKDIFIAVANESYSSAYFRNVEYVEMTRFGHAGNPFYGLTFYTDLITHQGGALPAVPTSMNFWVFSEQGEVTPTIKWKPSWGSYWFVLMNEDGSSEIAVTLKIDMKVPYLSTNAWVLFVSGLIPLAIGCVSVFLGLRTRERMVVKEETAPFLAIMQADLESLFKSKITYGWLIAAVFMQVIRVLSTSPFTITSRIITEGLSDFIYIWSMFIIGLAASAVASESGEFADSIMSKSVKRYDYILAKFASHTIHTIVVYSAITAVLVGASSKMVTNDYEIYGLIAATLFVALTLIMLTSMGVALSTILPNTVIAIIALLVVWYSMTFFFPLLDLESLSPSNIINQLPDIIQGAWNGEEWNTFIGFTIISLVSTALSTAYFTTKDL